MPKMELAQAAKVTPKVNISMNKFIRMIRFRVSFKCVLINSLIKKANMFSLIIMC